jgi:flagella synthesis protein FlgN
VDPASSRETLASLISQESAALVELATLLEREHGCLVANDVESLELAMADRQQCVGTIVRIEEERRSMCRMMGFSNDLPGLEKLLAWCDPSGSLKPLWAECAKRGARCRELNDRNGALVNARLKRVEALLGALTGQPSEGSTYGRAGAYKTPSTGRVLTTQA